MNSITTQYKNNSIIYILKGPLNTTLKTRTKIHNNYLNNIKIPRNLTTAHITTPTSEETQYLVERVKDVMPEIKLPAVNLAYISNKFTTNILSNTKTGTYIKKNNTTKYFRNIKTPTRGKGFFLRKGAGKILIDRIINDMRKEGIKTMLVHPSNKDLETYYSEQFGFKIIKNVLRNINSHKYYEDYDEGRLMYLEL